MHFSAVALGRLSVSHSCQEVRVLLASMLLQWLHSLCLYSSACDWLRFAD
jgi:hypothetical protein